MDNSKKQVFLDSDLPRTGAAPASDDPLIPRNIWILWLQGWENAPDVVKAAHASWVRKNPTWKVHFLDRQSLETYISEETLDRIFQQKKSLNAFANQVRLELLHQFGGVWADATTICATPLDQWLPACLKKGFFAFALPFPKHMLSNWFLAAVPASYILEKWRDATWEYWGQRTEMHTYFWMHGLFYDLYRTDMRFRADWNETPKISAKHRFHFGPDAPELFEIVPQDIEEALADPPAPVFKLTHKLSLEPGSDSLYKYLCRYATR